MTIKKYLPLLASQSIRKKGGKVAKAATARKLLEQIYHMMRVGKTFKEVAQLAEFLNKHRRHVLCVIDNTDYKG